MEPWTFTWLMSLTVVVAGLIRVQNREINCLRAHTKDDNRPPTPELISIWKKRITNYQPGSAEYESYKASLERAGIKYGS